MLLNEYEIEFMFRKIRNLGNVHIRGPHIVMSRTDAQNGLDFHFNFLLINQTRGLSTEKYWTEVFFVQTVRFGGFLSTYRASEVNKTFIIWHL